MVERADLPLLTPEEFATRHGMRVDQVLSDCRNGLLRHVKFGRLYRIPRSVSPNGLTWDDVADSPEIRTAVVEALAAHGRDEVLRRLRATAMRKPITPAVREKVVAQYGRVCQYCDSVIKPRARLTIDHVIPVSLGGTDELGNLVVACMRCNASKGSRRGERCDCGHLLWEWAPPEVHPCSSIDPARPGRRCQLRSCHEGHHRRGSFGWDSALAPVENDHA